MVAFFPAAFSPPCTNELISLQQKIDSFQDEGAKVFGVSVDNPFALHAFRKDGEFDFQLINDTRRDAAEAYGIKTDVEDVHLHDVANRSVFVIDEDGEVT